MNKFVVDSSAWIEYLQASKKGDEIRKLIDSEECEIFCSVASLAEMTSLFKRRSYDVTGSFEALVRTSTFFDIDNELAFDAGNIHAEMRKTNHTFGLADAFVIATAKRLNAKIVTCDYDFKPIKNAIII